MVAEGDTVAVRVTLHGTPAAALNWVEGLELVTPNGKGYAMREYVFWRVVDGKIVGRSIVIDVMEAIEQLGIPIMVKAQP
jgi:predicted ester cyclase